MNMTDAQLAQWLEALRSGQFAQTHKVLTDYYHRPAFCCMGVYGKVVLNLDINILRQIGLLSSLGGLDKTFNYAEEDTLAKLNDYYKLTFSQIAAFVAGDGLTLCASQFEEDFN